MTGVVDPSDERIQNFAVRSLSAFIRAALPEQTRGRKLVEVGCARSAWLPYFASILGFDVNGIDYSGIGCVQARELLAAVGAEGTIYEGDVFAPPEELIRVHDVVISFGLVEHFSDTVACVKALAALLAENGTMITVIPNLTGLLGSVEKRLDRDVFDLHMPLTLAAVASAHNAAGMRVVKCVYVMGSNWAVLNVGTWPKGWRRSSTERIISWATKCSWLLERTVPGVIRPNRLSSPYIGVIAVLDTRYRSSGQLRAMYHDDSMPSGVRT